MNKYISRALKAVALILPLLFIFIFAQEYLFDNRDYDTYRIEAFYEEEENSLDVVFMGASEVTAGYAPGYAYEQYGFTSYMYAIDANRGSLYLPQLKEILKHQNPEILFVDLYGFLHADDEYLSDEVRLRIFTESVPFSANKYQTVMNHPTKHKLSYFFPLIMYHGDPSIAYGRLLDTYRTLTKDAKPSPLKGAMTKTVVYTGEGTHGAEYDPATHKLTNRSKEILVEFLEYCKSRNLNVVFTNFPRYLADENQHTLMFLLNQAAPIVAQYGYPLLNLQKEADAIGIDTSHDYYNVHHLNIYGQIKLTDYLGNLIVNEYGLTPRPQSESNKLEWEHCASNTKEYIEMAKDAIQSGNDILIHENAVHWKFRN